MARGWMAVGESASGGRARIAVGLFLIVLAALAAWMLLDAWRLDPAPSGPGSTPDPGPVQGPGEGPGIDGRGASLSCQAAENGLGIAFSLFALATVGCLIAALALRGRSRSAGTFGVVAAVAAVPALLLGGFWYLVSRLCDGDVPELPQYDCSQLLWTFGIAAFVLAAMGVAAALLARRGRRGAWGVVSAVAFALLVLAVVMWVRTYLACHPPDGPEEVELEVELPCSFAIECGERIEFLMCLAVFFFALGVIFVVIGVISGLRGGRAWWRSGWAIAGFVIIAIGGALLLLWGLWVPSCELPSGGGGGGGGGEGGEGDARPVPEVPRWVLVAVLAVLALAAVATALLLRGRRSDEDAPGSDPEAAPPLTARERARLAAILERPTESREAVIAAYRAFLDWCQQHDLSKQPQEAPGEHAARVVAAARLDPAAAGRLVDLYGLARLTPWRPSDAERQEAIDAARRLTRP